MLNTATAATASNSPVIGNIYRNHNATRPTKVLTWPDLEEMVRNPARTPKDATALVIPSTAPGKTKDVIEAFNSMTLPWVDIDAGNILLTDLVAKIESLRLQAVIYSTASANRVKKVKVEGIETFVLQGNRWRIVFLLSESLDCEAWLQLQEALAAFFGGGSEACRIQQGLYAPTNADGGYYEFAIVEGSTLDPHNLPAELLSLIEAEAEKRRLQEEKARSAPTPKRVKVEGDSIIELANQAYGVRDLVEGEGHERHRNRYLHRKSTSGEAGIIIFEDGGKEYYFSHHGPETDSLADGHRHDAFDLLLHWWFGGDMRLAIKTLADELDPEGQKRRAQEWKEEQIHGKAGGVDDDQDDQDDQGDEAKAGSAMFRSAADFLDEETSVFYLVDKWIEEQTLVFGFGPWGSGKSFIAFDLGIAAATGGDFAGQRCSRGLVLYALGEGQGGGKRRVKGIAKQKGLTAKDLELFHLSTKTVTLDGSGADALIREARKIEKQLGERIAMVVIDTLARHMDGNENSSEDMGAFVKAVDRIKEELGCVVLVITHSGHGEETRNRPRGSSAAPAAADTIIKISDGVMTFLKQKEGEIPSPVEFKLVPVEIGRNDDGEPITTCIVNFGERAAKHRTATMTQHEQVIVSLLERAGGIMPACDLRQAFYNHRRAMLPDVSTDTIKRSWLRSLDTLSAQKVIEERGSDVSLSTVTNRDKSEHCHAPSQDRYRDKTGHTPKGCPECHDPGDSDSLSLHEWQEQPHADVDLEVLL